MKKLISTFYIKIKHKMATVPILLFQTIEYYSYQ